MLRTIAIALAIVAFIAMTVAASYYLVTRQYDAATAWFMAVIVAFLCARELSDD